MSAEHASNRHKPFQIYFLLGKGKPESTFQLLFRDSEKSDVYHSLLARNLLIGKKSGYHNTNESMTRVSTIKSMRPHVPCTVVAVSL